MNFFSSFLNTSIQKLKLSMFYTATTGLNLDEILRVVESIQLTAKYNVATPANWKPGEECMIAPSLDNEQARVLIIRMKNLFLMQFTPL